MSSFIKATSALALFAMFCMGCAEESPDNQATASASYVVAVNSPLQYFASRLLNGNPEVRLLAPADSDPSQWIPSSPETLELQQAELIFLNGAGYSKWVDKVSIAGNRLVPTTDSARQQWIIVENTVTHSHGPGGEHAHAGYAFTTWMDFSIAQVQARAVASALIERWPQRRAEFEEALTSMLADLQELDRAYSEVAAQLQDQELVYSHPVYQYFERRYGLAGTSLHWEPHEMPQEQKWSELEQLKSQDMLFVWEAQPMGAIADRMDSLNVRYAVVDPAANNPGEDWLELQRENVENLSAALP